MALNIELRHLCQRQNTGDRWRNSIFNWVVRATYVPKIDLCFIIFFSIFCNLLSWCAPNFLPQHQAAFGDIDGASPTHSPKSGWECPHRWRKSFIPPDNRPNKNMPHRWRISFHPEEGICPKNRACFQTIPKHIDGASQAMA